jgi:hypothetical protein
VRRCRVHRVLLESPIDRQSRGNREFMKSLWIVHREPIENTSRVHRVSNQSQQRVNQESSKSPSRVNQQSMKSPSPIVPRVSIESQWRLGRQSSKSLSTVNQVSIECPSGGNRVFIKTPSTVNQEWIYSQYRVNSASKSHRESECLSRLHRESFQSQSTVNQGSSIVHPESTANRKSIESLWRVHLQWTIHR